MQLGTPRTAPPRSASRWREASFWFLALVAVRLGVMLGIGWLTKGRHFTDDWLFQMAFIEDPFQILLAHAGKGAPYQPPLAPFISFLFGAPLVKALSSFYAIRCFSILGELLAWPLVWSLITTVVASPRAQRLLALTYVVMPVGWATSSLFAEEEPFAMLILCAIMLLALKRRIEPAILLAGVAVVASKVYFLIPMLALTVGPRAASFKELARRAALGASPIVLVYGFQHYWLWVQNKPDPLMEFTPHGIHAVSIWVLIRAWLNLSLITTKYASMATGLIAGLIPLVVAKARRVRCEGLTLVWIMVAMQLAVYMWFYHCDPEYYLIVTPGLLVSLPPAAAAVIAICGFAVPYAINLFYGVARARGTDIEAGKQVIVHLYDRLVPMDPDTLHTVALLALCALSVAVTWWMTVRIARAPRENDPLSASARTTR
jgi:hypothetical protein